MQQLPACQPVQENSPREERELSQLVQSACAVLPAHQPQEASTIPLSPNCLTLPLSGPTPGIRRAPSQTLTSLVFPHL